MDNSNDLHEVFHAVARSSFSTGSLFFLHDLLERYFLEAAVLSLSRRQGKKHHGLYDNAIGILEMFRDILRNFLSSLFLSFLAFVLCVACVFGYSGVQVSFSVAD